MKNLNAAVDNFDFFHCIDRQGFVFTSITTPANVLDAIVIRNPENSDTFSPKKTYSKKSLNEHIDAINEHNIKKAVIIGQNIDFITRCPTLKYLEIIPADTISGSFDYSPLYQMPKIEYLSCRTTYGTHQKPIDTCIDYSKINGLKTLVINNKSHLNYQQIETLEHLYILNNKLVDLSNLGNLKNLIKLELFNCGLKTLKGVSKLKKLQKLSVSYDRTLFDVSEIEKLDKSLRTLSIENCPKIDDFTFLNKLVNLEHLELMGNNVISDLNFLSNMRLLKVLSFSMNVNDSDLSPCLTVPYVWCAKNRKKYNLKDKDLPKNIPTGCTGD